MTDTTATIEIPKESLEVVLERAEIEFDELLAHYDNQNIDTVQDIAAAIDDVRESVDKEPTWRDAIEQQDN